MDNIMPTLSIAKGHPVVSSLSIAEHFGKEHKNVLRDIKSLEIPEEFNALNFELVEYADAKGESRPAYNLTRDGFTILVMGFTGKAAMQWKIRYIEAFNAMERELVAPKSLPDDIPTKDEFVELYQLITEWSTLLRDSDVWEPHTSLQNALVCMMYSIGEDDHAPVSELTSDKLFHACEYLKMQIINLSGAPATPVKSQEEIKAAQLRSDNAKKAAQARWGKVKGVGK